MAVWAWNTSENKAAKRARRRAALSESVTACVCVCVWVSECVVSERECALVCQDYGGFFLAAKQKLLLLLPFSSADGNSYFSLPFYFLIFICLSRCTRHARPSSSLSASSLTHTHTQPHTDSTQTRATSSWYRVVVFIFAVARSSFPFDKLRL